MPVVTEPPAVQPGRDEAMIRKQLAAAAGRIRLTDLLTGGAAVLALTLGYAAFALILDKWLDLPAAVRQIGFVAYLAAALGLAVRLILRPLARKVNPLYAAKRVESTAPDAKNAVVNWVDLEGDNLPAAVQAAVRAKAAAELRDANLTEAASSRSLVKLGILAATLVVVLLVLFVRFSPAQFKSLVSRAFTPFSAGKISARTRLTLTAPAGGDVTVTAGQPVVVTVEVDGRTPPEDGPDRVRLRVRYNLESTEFEELPLEPGATNKEWQLRVPTAVVQNGCWYRVAAGDGETPEYRITVRSRPLLTGFEARYEYPAYLRLKPETTREPKLEAYRGTKVTLIVTTNRDLRDGSIAFDTKAKSIPGTITNDAINALRFSLTLEEDANYRIHFTATTGEIHPESYPYPIRVLADRGPAVTIVRPAEEEVSQPANGRLEVDARATDDQGIDTVTLKFLLGGRPLAPRPYQGGKSFKRDADNSFPTLVESKDSFAFAELKNEAGRPVNLKEGDVLEYWVEAADNCTVPAANVGKSKVQRVKILAPETKPEPQKQQEQQADKRKQEEKAHDQKQQEKFDKENRETKPQQQPDPGEKQPEEGQPDKGQPDKGQPDKGQPDKGQPDKGQPDKGQPDKGQPDKGQPDKGQPDKGQPDKGQPDKGQPDKGQPDKGQPDKGQPDKGQPDKGQPDKGQPDKGQPDKGQPDKGQPDKGQPDKGQPDKGQPDKGQPSGGQSGLDEQQRRETTQQAEKVSKEINKQQAQADAKAVEQAMKDVASGNPEQQERGRKELEKQFGKQSVDDAMKQAEQMRKDLQSPDKKTREDAEKKLEKTVGKEAMEQAKKDAEKLKNDLKSDNPETRAAAEKKLEEMKQQAGQNAGGQQKPDPKEMEQAINDMKSNDPDKQKQGREKLEQQLGKDAVAQAEKEAKQIEKDLNSGNPDKKAAAEKKLEEMKQQAGAGGQKPDPKEIDQAIKGMKSGDPDKQKQGREKLEQQLGKDAVAQAEKEAKQIEKDLNSGNPDKKAAAEKKLEEMKQQAGAAGQQKPDPAAQAKAEAEKKEIENAVKQMQSNDPKEQQAGRQKLEEKFGKDAVAQAEKDARQLQQDLQSKDPKTREAAEKKLENMAGKDAADKAKAEAKQLQEDLKSDNPEKRAAAEKKLKDMADKMMAEADKTAKQDGTKPDPKPGEKLDPKQADNLAKDLAGDDQKKQQEAKEQIEKALGKEAADKAAKQADEAKKDLKSFDAEQRGKAEEKLSNLAKDLKNQAEKQGQNDKGLSPEEMKKLAEKAKDLNSPDPDKKAQAEKEFDDKFGKENRQALQDALKDQKPGEPKSEEQQKKDLEQWADKIDPNWRSGKGAAGSTEGTPLEDDPKSKLRTHELQLKTLKDHLGDKELFKKLGLGEEDAQRLIQDMEKIVEQDKADLADWLKDPKAFEAKRPTINVNRGNKVGAGTQDTKGPAAAGTAAAPPGYADAQKRFIEKTGNKPKSPDNK